MDNNIEFLISLIEDEVYDMKSLSDSEKCQILIKENALLKEENADCYEKIEQLNAEIEKYKSQGKRYEERLQLLLDDIKSGGVLVSRYRANKQKQVYENETSEELRRIELKNLLKTNSNL